MAEGNAIGEKLPMFVIGSCFKHIKNLPCKYKSQKKSWIDSQIFEEWVRKLNRIFRMEEKKIALHIDNCPAYPSAPDLTNLELVFFYRLIVPQFYN